MSRGVGPIPSRGPADEEVVEVVIDLLRPEDVTPGLVSRAIARARRCGIYFKVLNPMERALLKAASMVRVRRYTSPKIRRILADLVARIELYTRRGAVMLAGIRRALSIGPLGLNRGLRSLSSWTRRKVDYIMYLGISMLEVMNYFTPFMRS